MNNVFLFHGPETFLSREKINLWKNIFTQKHGVSGFCSIDCEAHDEQSSILGTLRRTLQQPPLFQKNAFTVISKLSSLKNPEGIDSILSLCSSLPQSHVVVFFEDELLDSHSFFKKCSVLAKKGALTMECFETLHGTQLLTWASTRAHTHKSTLPQKEALHLIKLLTPQKQPFSKEPVSPSLWRLEQELLKLCAYRFENTISIQDINELVVGENQSHLFDLTDALLTNSLNISLGILQNLLDVPKASLRKEGISITGFLCSQIRSFLVLKNMQESNISNQESAEKLSWNPKRLWVVSQKIQNNSSQQFQKCYSLLLRLDSDLKTKFLDPLHSLERTLITIHTLLLKKSS